VADAQRDARRRRDGAGDRAAREAIVTGERWWMRDIHDGKKPDIYDGKKPEPQPVPSADNLWVQAGGDWARYKELLRKYAHRGDDD
jgi:hypothetical protein